MKLRDRLKSRTRPARPVELPAGGAAHVRPLTLGELRVIDARAKEVAGEDEQSIRLLELFGVYALVEETGHRCYPDATAGDMAEVGELLTPADLKAIRDASVPSVEQLKNV